MTRTIEISNPDTVNEAYAELVQVSCIVDALYRVARQEDAGSMFTLGESLGGVKALLDQCSNKLADCIQVGEA